MDPDETHVWMISRRGGFREFGALGAEDASHLRKYTTVTPSDEYRSLYFDAGTSSPTYKHWLLKGLDGSIEIFHPKDGALAGLWKETRDRLYDPLNPTAPHTATAATGYTGVVISTVTYYLLDGVSFPDGRSETFAYWPGSGRLKSITENGVGGGTRVWQYFWGAGNTGLDLTSILRPDGTHWDLHYDDAAHPGYLTRVDFLDALNNGRIDAAFAYDAKGNVLKQWRGDVSDVGPNATNLVTYSFDSASLPTVTTLTRLIKRDPLHPVTNDVNQIVTYSVSRDPGRAGGGATLKPRILNVVGDCPTCGNVANATYTYDTNQPMMVATMKDAKNTVTAYSYNSNGRLTQRTEAQGLTDERTTVWDYTNANFPAFVTKITGPFPGHTLPLPATNPRILEMSYDNAKGNLQWREARGTEAGATLAGQTAGTFALRTNFSAYSAAGQPGQIDPPSAPASSTDSTVYDFNVLPSRGGFLPLSRRDPVIGDLPGTPKSVFEYDAFNRRTAVVDPNGVRTETQYFPDATHLNRVQYAIQRGDPGTAADDLTTEYQYNGWGDLTCVQYPRGNAVTYQYDFIGRLIKVQRRASCAATQILEETEFTLDAVGHRIAETKRHYTGATPTDDATTSYAYSTSCHLDSVTQPGGTVTTYAYDCNNNLEKIWDANTPTSGTPSTTNGYDLLNRLTSVTQPWTGAGGTTAVTQYQYDAQDHLRQVTDAEGNATTYTTSDRDRLTSQVSPVSGTTSSAYDAHGNLTGQTDARNIVETRGYDDLDRLKTRVFSDGTPTVTNTWDAAATTFRLGRLSRIAQGTTQVDYDYDAFGRMTRDGALTYGYDANGNRSAIGYGGGTFACYAFDNADRQSSMTLSTTAACNAGLQSLVTASSYLASGPLASVTLGNALVETHAYDQRFFPTEIRAKLGSADRLWWTLGYVNGATTDNVGNILTITDNINAATRTYGYQSPQYFLVQGDGPWGGRSWVYDRIGNRTSETRVNGSPVTDNYSYAGSGHNPELQSIALGGGGTQGFLYDLAGNEVANRGPLAHLDLSYDAANRLTRIRETLAATETTMTYDGRNFLTQARQDVSQCSPIVTQATYSSAGLLMARTETNLLSGAPLKDAQIFYFAGRPIAIRDSGTIRYVSVDHLGTPNLFTDAAGALVWSGGLEPFGRDWSGAQAAGGFLRFPGQWDDATWSGSGLFYNLNRWFSVATGSYVSPDPLTNLGSWPVFGYALERPTLITDTLGLAPSNAECCQQAFDKHLFKGNDGFEAGGIAICCGSRKVGCALPYTNGNPMFDVPGELLVADCVVKHEEQHFSDVTCPDCSPGTYPVSRPPFEWPMPWARGPAECRAARIEMPCLRQKLPLCGGNARCLQIVNDWMTHTSNVGNAFQPGCFGRPQ